MMRNRHLYIFIILISFSVNAQEKKDWYSAFGKTPALVDSYLYKELKNAKDFQTRAKLIDTIASIHIQTGITDSIIYYGNLLQDEVMSQKELLLNRNLYLSKAYHILGKGKLEKGLYDDAMKHHFDGIEISPIEEMEKMHNLHQIALGVVYLHQLEVETALSIFETCIKNTEDKEVLLLAIKYKADILLFQKKTEEAKENYKKAQELLLTQKNIKVDLDIKIRLGRIDVFENKLEQGLEHFISVKDQALKHNFYDLYIDAVIRVGIIYYRQGHLEASQMVLSTAYANTLQWNKLELQRDVIKVLRNIEVAEKDYENAYNLMTQYVSISNQILENQNKVIAKEMEAKYQTLQKEKEILSLKEEQLLKESEIKRQRTIKKAFLIGFLVVLIPVIALLFLYFQKLKTQIALNKSQKEVNSQKVYGLMKDQELNLVKATMDGQNKERRRLARELHDSIGGNLASIKLQLSSNTSNNESIQTKILNQIDETYHQVRDLSHNLASKKFQNNGISTLIKEYVNNIEQGSKQKISFNPHPEEKINEIENPLKEELFKIIQELLTNTLKHAKADQIDIYLNQYQTILQLLFEDNGIGFNSEKMAEGIGFKNIKNRLHSLSGNMVIDSTIDRGTVINIEIPVS
ncbi:histidine kinase [Aquimarina sp. BL5]|uniref:tetratricopeptide repeat-containing sensor histidine kinase n=1 Tax=Aquimarina sp. BL5 TaxID=1714860 RepID=UPI000E47259A|nr:histidine kinase [Aquimarina sp. BL5]AXT51620.1 histidine kinase [Aquimarina sp. BL5]RKN08518.1 histidine kinase [Aquimarina sp. BL5]